MTTSKMGRPKTANPKNVEIKVRFQISTNEKLLDYSMRQGIARAAAIRRAVDLLLSDN